MDGQMDKTRERAIITVVGRDIVGIIARVCSYLAENNVNILDISQTIVSGFFNMLMIVDLAGCDRDFGELSRGLALVGEGVGVRVSCQREEIFEMMHRI